MAILALALWNWIEVRVEIRARVSGSPVARRLLQAIFVVGFVMIIGVAWEWYEFLFDHFAGTIVQKLGVAQPSLADTMDDLFNDFIGAIVAWVFWRKRP